MTQLKVILSHWGTLTHEESQALLEANKLLNRTHGNLTPSQHAQLDALLFKHYGTAETESAKAVDRPLTALFPRC